MKTRNYIISDILWDLDQTTTDEGNPDLPQEIMVEVTEGKDVDDIEDEEEIEDYLSNYITDLTGFCHGGFSSTEV